ncbi:hypothetical protein I316_06177 [Kwoniella heveanensis BCC8398]|uniref:Major facilitator superfamily (MFS) profile domain-containing protein n=1 Tax=Kwoniella heveanensis BCC8398 TaxID=1296120 RepID=A0A1B9GMK1_9TREE|nr:hypothetical protein I316_06177 [Kwoniella heveanensis BCC8398]
MPSTTRDAEASPAERPVSTLPYTTFSHRQRLLIITIASFSATFSGFASNIYFPVIPTMAEALYTTPAKINLTVTSYMIFQAICPTFWGAVSDAYGRRLTVISTLTVFLGACIGLALTQHYYQLVILRCLQSAGSASTIAIGSGIIGDVTTKAERGGYMGYFQTGLLLPLAIGPVLGGIFASALGWRSLFWFLVIYSGVFLLFLALVLPETLRSIVGNGAVPPFKLARSPLERFTSNRVYDGAAPARGFSLNLLGPIRILFAPEVNFVSFFLAIHYATWQMALTAQATLFENLYSLSEIDNGLTFIANGFGCMIGSLTTGKLLDKEYRRHKAKYTGPEEEFPIEIVRLRSIWFWSPLQWGALLLFGWTLDKQVHIAAPIIASFILAWSAMSTQAVISTFLVDIFPKSAASATAALNLARCLMGAGATAQIEPLYSAVGVGWAFTLWTGAMALSLGLVAVQMRWGAGWRRKRERREEDKAKIAL